MIVYRPSGRVHGGADVRGERSQVNGSRLADESCMPDRILHEDSGIA
jgi:hypothetical protein